MNNTRAIVFKYIFLIQYIMHIMKQDYIKYDVFVYFVIYQLQMAENYYIILCKFSTLLCLFKTNIKNRLRLTARNIFC